MYITAYTTAYVLIFGWGISTGAMAGMGRIWSAEIKGLWGILIDLFVKCGSVWLAFGAFVATNPAMKPHWIVSTAIGFCIGILISSRILDRIDRNS